MSTEPTSPFDRLAADRLAAAVDLLVGAGTIDARSPAADARLDYGSPFSPEVALEILNSPDAAVDNWRAEERDARDLVESGLLFEVNRRVFHPLGLALAVDFDGRSHRISRRLVRTTDPGGLEFSADALRDGYERLSTFMREGGYERLAARYERLGYRSQVPPPTDVFADEADWGIARPGLAEAAAELLEAAADVADSWADLETLPLEVALDDEEFARLGRAVAAVREAE